MKQGLGKAAAILAWACAAFLLAQPAIARAGGFEEGVPLARDLSSDAALAREKNGVVLVMFTGEYCGYCERVLNEFLLPMSRNADYQSKLVMRRVVNTGVNSLRGFDGKPLDHHEFSAESGVRMVPTVMLFDSRGKPLSKPLVGISSSDYYGFYLDERIDQALSLIRGR